MNYFNMTLSSFKQKLATILISVLALSGFANFSLVQAATGSIDSLVYKVGAGYAADFSWPEFPELTNYHFVLSAFNTTKSEGYDVYNGSNTSATDADLTLGDHINYTLFVVNDDDNVVFDSYEHLSLDIVVPTAGLTATNSSFNGLPFVQLTWTAPEKPVGATFVYSINVTKPDAQVDNVLSSTKINEPLIVNDYNVEPSSTYIYDFTATDTATGKIVSVDNVSVTTPEVFETLELVGHIDYTAGLVDQISLSWTNLLLEDEVDSLIYQIDRHNVTSNVTDSLDLAGDVTAMTDDALEAGNTYEYRIFAYRLDKNDLVTQSNILKLTVPQTADLIQIYGATDIDINPAGGINLNWTTVDHPNEIEITYNLYRSFHNDPYSLIDSSVFGTSFVDKDYAIGNSYQYFVEAIDASGNILGYSPVITVIALEQIIGFTVNPDLDSNTPKMLIEWGKLNPFTGSDAPFKYMVFRLEDGSEKSEVIFSGDDVYAATDESAEAGKAYTYSVYAYSGEENIGLTDELRVFIPNKMDLSVAAVANDNDVNLNWAEIKNTFNEEPVFYEIVRFKADGTVDEQFFTDKTSFLDTTANESTSYMYAVRAYNDPGLDMLAYSSKVAVTTNKAPNNGGNGGGGGGGGGNGGGGGGKSEKQDNNIINTVETLSTLSDVVVCESFKDLDGHWAKDYIEALRLKGVLCGKSIGYFEPNTSISRAEFVKIMMLLVGVTPDESVTESPFADVKLSEWHVKYLAAAKAKGLIVGDKDNKFSPNTPVTRAEVAKWLFDASGWKIEGGVMNYPDTQKGAWYEKYVAYANLKGIMVGYTDGNFGPSKPLTRAELAKVAYLFMQLNK